MNTPEDEDTLLRSVALQNANSILIARQRAEELLLQTKEALRESQERLRAALNAAGTGTFRWNIQANTVEWDGNLDRLFGLDPGRTIRSLETFIEAVHPDDRAAFVAACERSASDGRDFNLEFRVVGPDGSVHWIDDKAKAFFDSAGRPLYMTGACADVTARKEAAETLRASEERLRAMFHQAAVGIVVGQLDGRFLDVNRKFSELLGYSRDELHRFTFADITHPEDLEQTLDSERQLIAGTINEYSIEKRFVRKDAAVVWCLTTVTLLRDVEGHPQQFLGVLDDISDRKRTEAALREQTRVLELLNETGTKLASNLDTEAVVQAVVDAGTALSGARVGAFVYNTSVDGGEQRHHYTLSGPRGEALTIFEQLRVAAWFIPTFRGEGPIRSDDLQRDPRSVTATGGERGAHALPVRSYMAVPVRSRSGDVVGGLFFAHPEPEVFTARTEVLIAGVAAQGGIAIDNARLYEAAQ